MQTDIAPFGYTKAGQPRKRPARPNEGKPSIYDPSMCETVIELGKQGKSRTQIAAQLDISWQCLHEWERDRPEFGDALSRARRLSQAWWENTGQDNLSNRDFNAPLYKLHMVNRFPQEWADRREIEHKGEGYQGDIEAPARQLARALAMLIEHTQTPGDAAKVINGSVAPDSVSGDENS